MGNGLKINSNPGAMTAVRNLRSNGDGLHRAVERLSSGPPLNSVADDAVEMSVSENLRAQQRGFQKALRNASDGVAMVQISEAGYQSISDTLIRMRELAVEADNGAASDAARGFLDSESSELITLIDRVSSVTEYNNAELLDGSMASLTFQIGARNSVNGWFDMSLDAQSSSGLGVNDDTVHTLSAAQVATGSVDSRQEPSEFARQHVLQATGVAILTQANANTGMALRLLR